MMGTTMALIQFEQVAEKAPVQRIQCAICKTNTSGIDRRTLQSDGMSGVFQMLLQLFRYIPMEFYCRTQPGYYRLKKLSHTYYYYRLGIIENFVNTVYSLDFSASMMFVREATCFVTCSVCHTQFLSVLPRAEALASRYLYSDYYDRSHKSRPPPVAAPPPPPTSFRAPAEEIPCLGAHRSG